MYSWRNKMKSNNRCVYIRSHCGWNAGVVFVILFGLWFFEPSVSLGCGSSNPVWTRTQWVPRSTSTVNLLFPRDYTYLEYISVDYIFSGHCYISIGFMISLQCIGLQYRDFHPHPLQTNHNPGERCWDVVRKHPLCFFFANAASATLSIA